MKKEKELKEECDTCGDTGIITTYGFIHQACPFCKN